MFTFGNFAIQEKLFAVVSALLFSTACIGAAVGPAEISQSPAPVQVASMDASVRA